jgi:hypothetical protein
MGRGPVAAEMVLGAAEPFVKPPTATMSAKPVGPVEQAIPLMEYRKVSGKGLYGFCGVDQANPFALFETVLPGPAPTATHPVEPNATAFPYPPAVSKGPVGPVHVTPFKVTATVGPVVEEPTATKVLSPSYAIPFPEPPWKACEPLAVNQSGGPVTWFT